MTPFESAIPFAPLGLPKRTFFQSLVRQLRPGGRHAKLKMLLVRSGLAAAALLVLIGIAVWVLNQPNPDALLKPADALYEKGSLADAIQGYSDFLDHFPREAASAARVRRGLAQLRLAAAGPAGQSAALETAKTVLPAISPETAYDAEAGPVLATLLPEVAQRLAWQARQRLTPSSVAEAQEMLSLAEQYLPVADKPREQLGSIEASLALTRHKIAGDDELHKAIAAIRLATAAKNFYGAYRVLRRLARRLSQVVQELRPGRSPPRRHRRPAGGRRLGRPAGAGDDIATAPRTAHHRHRRPAHVPL